MSPADEPLVDGTAPGDIGSESQGDVVDDAGQEANAEPHAGDPEPPGAASCTVVGIGASAGGLEALASC